MDKENINMDKQNLDEAMEEIRKEIRRINQLEEDEQEYSLWDEYRDKGLSPGDFYSGY
jgi:chaperonin cofactor prefoldin